VGCSNCPLTYLICKIWYSIFRTVSDVQSYRDNTNDCSIRAFAVKPAPSARRYAALGLTARRGRATVDRSGNENLPCSRWFASIGPGPMRVSVRKRMYLRSAARAFRLHNHTHGSHLTLSARGRIILRAGRTGAFLVLAPRLDTREMLVPDVHPMGKRQSRRFLHGRRLLLKAINFSGSPVFSIFGLSFCAKMMWSACPGFRPKYLSPRLCRAGSGKNAGAAGSLGGAPALLFC
jgi:hypothetical protein